MHGGSVAPKLSICIATLNRGAFIAETLNTIVPQLTEETELVIVDGASADNTGEVVGEFAARCPQLRYLRLPAASGVDRDYDIAVTEERGDFVWLMTDDDLLHTDAVPRVIDAIRDDVELVVVNTEVRSVDFGTALSSALIATPKASVYGPQDRDELFLHAANALSFIGCVVIRRAFWMARDRQPYLGSLFVHVGVIFQGEVPRTRVLAEPLITIRYGNAMWTPRGFEIWMFKWPELVWSFSQLSEQARARITAPEPWRQFRKLWLYRSLGGYGMGEYRRFLVPRSLSFLLRLRCLAVAATPAGLANTLSMLWCALCARNAKMNMYDLARSRHATIISRWLGRAMGL